MKNRIDIELVKRNYFDSRAKAKYAIQDGLIYLNNQLVTKSNEMVSDNDIIEIIGNIMPYVSRGGLKLEKAVKEFNINLNNKIMVDVGSSTGGFSDFALQNGIKRVIAVDVGSNQLAQKLIDNPQLTLYEKTDFRKINISKLVDVQIATIDVSFISILKLIPKLNELKTLKEIVCLLKPQFEVGKTIADKYKGIINDPKEHEKVINEIINEFAKNDYFTKNLTYSPITGGDGNIEYLLYLKKNINNTSKINAKEIVTIAFREIGK